MALLLAVLCTADLFSQELSAGELESNIRKAEAQGNVSARSVISQYWQLVDFYINDKNHAKAYEIVIKGLRLDPWNYKYQKIAADIEVMNGDLQKASGRLNFIINNLSELAAIYASSVELQSAAGVKSAKNEIINIPEYYIYIAAFPYLNLDVVNLAAANISSTYGIGVKIISVGYDESRDDIRDKQLDVYNEIVNDVMSKYSNESVVNFLKEIGLTPNDLRTREGKRIFSYQILKSSEVGRQQWQLIEMTQNQYSGDALLDQLKRTFANYVDDPHCLGILGITRQDIYENDYNFLFGWAEEKWGIMSYARFLLGDPAPAEEQFEKRAIIQSLSSVGTVLGIPRPTNPNCARAYPHSLAEMDRKTMELCDECKANLRKLYSGLK
jgi:predicted Zn-dependent protease